MIAADKVYFYWKMIPYQLMQYLSLSLDCLDFEERDKEILRNVCKCITHKCDIVKCLAIDTDYEYVRLRSQNV